MLQEPLDLNSPVSPRTTMRRRPLCMPRGAQASLMKYGLPKEFPHRQTAGKTGLGELNGINLLSAVARGSRIQTARDNAISRRYGM